MDTLQVAPEKTLMIGDTTFDIEMGLAAGVQALGVAWGYHPPERLIGAGAHALAEAPDRLLAAVDALLSDREVAA